MSESSACAMAHQPQFFGALSKEPKLKFVMEIRSLGDALVMHCKGRITFREEARTFSRQVQDLASRTRQLVLDMNCVDAIDSAGLGELVAALHSSREAGCEMRLAAPSPRVLGMLQLTNLLSVLEVHPSVEEAALAFRCQMA